jgi:voltage-gated potassium channel
MVQSKQLQKEKATLVRRIENLLEGPMVFLGFVWLALLIIELIWGLTPTLELLSTGIWIVFIIDFLIKFSLAPKKIHYLKKNWLTIISLAIPALRVIRIVRFIRVFRSVRLVKVVASINRGMGSLGKAVQRRGLKYVVALTLIVLFAGSAGMYAFEKDVRGFTNYWEAVWWTAMLLITIGSDYWPKSGEARALCLLLSVYGFCVFGYITATLASFFVGRDAEEKDAPIASSQDIQTLQLEIRKLTEAVNQLKGSNG